MQKPKTKKENKKIIKINASTHTRLAKIGEKIETFDDIIGRLLDEHESNK